MHLALIFPFMSFLLSALVHATVLLKPRQHQVSLAFRCLPNDHFNFACHCFGVRGILAITPALAPPLPPPAATPALEPFQL